MKAPIPLPPFLCHGRWSFSDRLNVQPKRSYNPYQARAVNKQNDFVTEIFFFSVWRPQRGELRLDFCSAARFRKNRVGSGDPAKRLLGLSRDSRSPYLKTLEPRQPSSATIQRRSAVQKLRQFTQRLSIRDEGGCRPHRPREAAGGWLQLLVDVPLGRMLQN